MYKKLLHIKNYGRFINYSSKLSDWDGSFQKINIVYAPNGSGKTSLAELFRSTSGDSDIVIKKKTFWTDQNPDIKFILDDGKELKFNGKWNRSIANIDVFDSFYFDDNLYAISIYDDPQQPNIFELAISEEIALIKKTIFTLKSNKSSLSHKISNKKNYLRKNCLDYDSDNKLGSAEKGTYKNKDRRERKKSASQRTSRRLVFMSRMTRAASVFAASSSFENKRSSPKRRFALPFRPSMALRSQAS